ncbi:hypothetical protein [Streptomyces sp. NPDC085529]|uniref:hypothetical protein n=1 Tax=Streptomyces sp. NPDC085529 TaxID=3365729 RepID=UPI0037D40E6C
MKMMKAGRLMTAAGVAVAAVAAQIALAAPASAMYTGCLNYLKGEGYVVGPKVYAACSHEAIKVGFVWYPNSYCVQALTGISVGGSDALVACRRAHG